MKKDEIHLLITQERQRFSEVVRKAFPSVPFDDYHPPEKFIGLIQITGQKPIALFLKSNQPLNYQELAVSV